MSEVDVNSTGLLVGFQSAKDVDPTAYWQQEPNSYGAYGAKIKTLAREPISVNNQREEGGVVGLDADGDFEMDATREAWLTWASAILFSNKKGPASFRPTAVTSTGYTVASGGDLANGVLVYASGFTNDENNGLKLLAGTSTGTEIKTSGLVAEAAIPASQNVRVEVCGIQCASGDLVVASATSITSTALDWTDADYGLQVGQYVWIGGATGGAEVFATAADRGLIRLRTIAAGAITFDKAEVAFSADAGTSKTIRIFFGPFWRNVATTHADYNKLYSTLERLLTDLDSGSDVYEYMTNCLVAGVEQALAPEGKSTMKMSFVGTDAPTPTTSRKSGASTAGQVNLGEMFNTSSGIIRARLETTGGTVISADHESVTMKIARKVTAKKIVGTLGASKLNIGKFLANVQLKDVLTTLEVIAAVRNSTEVRFDIGLRNDDGGVMFDFPKGKLGDGSKDFAPDDGVAINLDFEAQRSPIFNYTMSLSMFPYLPAA